PLVAKLEQKKGPPVMADLEVALTFTSEPVFNVVGRLPAKAPRSAAAGKSVPVVVVGAHYDHLGYGDHHSLAPDSHLPHVGADDNASGTAGVLEAARQLASRADTLTTDVMFMAFSGEESGVLGSTHLTRTPPPGLAMKDVRAMINLDMVGRLRDNQV